jgi:hypothetical protein
LVRTIHNSPLFKKPPVGNNPFQATQNEKKEDNIELLNHMLKIIAQDYSEQSEPFNRWVETKTFMDTFKMSRILAEITVSKLVTLGLATWKVKNEKVMLSEKGKQYVLENKLI